MLQECNKASKPRQGISAKFAAAATYPERRHAALAAAGVMPPPLAQPHGTTSIQSAVAHGPLLQSPRGTARRRGAQAAEEEYAGGGGVGAGWVEGGKGARVAEGKAAEG